MRMRTGKQEARGCRSRGEHGSKPGATGKRADVRTVKPDELPSPWKAIGDAAPKSPSTLRVHERILSPRSAARTTGAWLRRLIFGREGRCYRFRVKRRLSLLVGCGTTASANLARLASVELHCLVDIARSRTRRFCGTRHVHRRASDHVGRHGGHKRPDQSSFDCRLERESSHC